MSNREDEFGSCQSNQERDMSLASLSVSMKRIADAMEKKAKPFAFVVLGRASNGDEIPVASFQMNADARRCQPLLEQLYGNTFIREIV